MSPMASHPEPTLRRSFPFLLLPIILLIFMLAAAIRASGPPAAAQEESPAATAASLTLTAQMDAWVDQGNPNTNYGGDRDLHVGRWGTVAAFNRQTLAWFDLSPLPPGSTILRASLRLYQIDAQGAQQYNIWPDAILPDPPALWDELKVTWNNKPPASNQGDPFSTLDMTDGWKSWDVKNIVQAWADDKIPNYGILLRGDGDTVGLRVFSARNDAQLAPRLVIEYNPPGCQELLSPTQIPSPGLINFDDLPNGAVIGNSYQSPYGVRFENTGTTRAIIYGNEPAEAQSPPNVAINDAVFPNTSTGVPMIIFFDSRKSHVGFWIGNGETVGPVAVLTAYEASGAVICQVRNAPVPEPHTEFIGLYDPLQRIAYVSLDYGQTALSESMDNLYFAPYAPPTRTPTPSPTATPAPPYPDAHRHADPHPHAHADHHTHPHPDPHPHAHPYAHADPQHRPHRPEY